MKNLKKSYYNEKWYNFSKKVRIRDNYQCLKCNRTSKEVVLQVHHNVYVLGLKPWEYPFSDCITLCKGCHAEEHKLIEPSKGWTLIGIEDLGGLYGTCERKGCKREIRYGNIAYHPNWGYKTVGSSCIELLTEEDKQLSSKVIKAYKNIGRFIHTSVWEKGVTKKGKDFIKTKYNHHILRIYGKENQFAFQVAVKKNGIKWHVWEKSIPAKNKTLNQVKELGYIVLKGTTTKNEDEKEMLRNIYQNIINL